ncbi:receptor-type tyrosine-protein phosphatase kappa-like [Dreissena polymorpha]|uniref:receptor-type tyrosine-protein phosphatase kappa-like n=1 Tax=Dreissena polymorpha TaxID=45954 RepID=UPI0022650D04|nr:receptor-type tyrosine-protein phosphatase kappa-like [Dreissena polymorpha]
MLISPAKILVANPNYDRSEEVLSLRRNGDSLQFESDTDVDVLEIDDDERRTLARHQYRPHSPVQQEENVYYIGLLDILQRKIVVDELAEFVASKPFEYFQEEFDKFPYGLTRPHNEARKPDNVAKNRYQGIYAYDDTRIKVKGGKNDYINANFVDGFLKRNAYIASLGPMKKQMGDFGIFWKMIWQHKVERVVMVTNLDEEGKTKCEKYWPDVDDTKAYGDVLVKGITEDVYAEYTRRTFKMTHGSNCRTLHHLHFTAWPDKGIPEDVTALIEFRQRVMRVQTKLDGPTLVHCSAGIGRTGTYIALDILIHEGEAEGAVEIQGCVLNMRRNRVNMIQTVEQYEFLHRALVHALTIDCAPVAANQFENYVSETGQQQREKQFNLLMSISQHMVPEEQDNMTRNKSLKNKNRRGADIPGDEYRPRLQVLSGTGDYINAVYIDSLTTKRHYIAAQSPLPGTVVDFLSLVYQEDCPCIVSFEQTQESKDVGMYYPADNQVLSRGDFTVSSFKMDEQMNNCVLRRLVVENKKNGGHKKTVTHISYADWEQDKSVPNSPANFIQFIHNVEKLASEGTNRGPVVLHCLDGAMKCGLFSVVSTLLQKIAIYHEVSVVNAVRKVMARRHGAIAAQDQFDFCYECVLQYIRSFGIYYNFAPL